jgi:hypothetical protein
LSQSAGHAEQPTTQITVGDTLDYASQIGMNLAEFFERHCSPTARRTAGAGGGRPRHG